jgi:F-type H+-transporting ATPase subunit delta
VPVSASAARYAAAAFGVASESGEYDQWLGALQDFARVLQMPSARTVFRSPAVSPADKRQAIDRLFPRLSPVVRNFLHILADRDRLTHVPQIAEAFRNLVNDKRGIITAEVTTAIPLDAELERLVAHRLGNYLQHDPQRVAIRARVDPSIIGGVVARVGDTLIDDSVRGRLERLRRTLSHV